MEHTPAEKPHRHKVNVPSSARKGPEPKNRFEVKRSTFFFFFPPISQMATLKTAEAAASLRVTTGHRAGRARRWGRERLRAQKPQSQKCFSSSKEVFSSQSHNLVDGFQGSLLSRLLQGSSISDIPQT